MRTGRIHKISIESSVRLQKIRDFLRQRGVMGATGLEIAAECDALNPATYVSHLRANGLVVDCEYDGRTGTGASMYRYRLREWARYDGSGQGILLG